MSSEIETIGSRLRAERERLGLSQEELAHVGGVGRGAQLRYEKGEGFPGADYLFSVTSLGIDVRYVITGAREGRPALPPEEATLLDAYRQTVDERRRAAHVVMQALAGQQASPVRYSIGQTQPMQLHEPAPSQYGPDAELWRAVARALPTTPGVNPESRLSLVQWLEIVDAAAAREAAEKARK